MSSTLWENGPASKSQPNETDSEKIARVLGRNVESIAEMGSARVRIGRETYETAGALTVAEDVGGPDGGLHAHLHGHGDWGRRAASDFFCLVESVEARILPLKMGWLMMRRPAAAGFNAQL